MLALKPHDLQSFMDHHTIQGEILYLSVPTPTVEIAAQALGVAIDQIVKSILFIVHQQSVLAIANGTALIDKRTLAAEFGVSRKKVKLATPAEMLVISGYEAGAMPPFGHLQPLPTVIDRQVLSFPEVFAGGGAENAMLRINPSEILRVSAARVISLTGNPSEQ